MKPTFLIMIGLLTGSAPIVRADGTSFAPKLMPSAITPSAPQLIPTPKLTSSWPEEIQLISANIGMQKVLCEIAVTRQISENPELVTVSADAPQLAGLKAVFDQLADVRAGIMC